MSLTITDIAKLADVSKATVSAVINNKPGVSKEKRAQILEIIKKFNYRPNYVARSLSSQQTKCIGLVIKEIDNPFYARVMKGIFDTCVQNGYTVLLGSSELSPEKELQSIETLRNQRVDGLIISPLQSGDIDFSYIYELIKEQYPVVMLGIVRNFQTNVVDINNVRAAYEAVSYLINLGHSKIAYFAGPQYSAHSEDRLQGYRQALIENSIPINQHFIIQVGSYIRNGFDAGKQLFTNSGDHPTAVFCYNDLLAFGLINALTDINLNIPEDVSIVGFDNNDYCESIKVPLTTVHVPSYEIGIKAAALLINQIANRDKLLNEHIVLDANLVIRDSCRKI